MSQVFSPMIPYNGPIPGGMFPGRMIRVHGNVPVSADKFAVNLLSGSTGDIALHVSPHFHSHHVVRNSVQQMRWGHEEKHGSLPIRPGQNFDLVILCEPSYFKIAFNGAHFAEFHHRLPYNCVTNLAIDGQVMVSAISFEGGPGAGGIGAPGHVGGFTSVPHQPHVPSAPYNPHAPYPSGGAAPYPPGGVAAPYPPAAGGHYPSAVGGHYPAAGAAPYPMQPGHGLHPPGAHGYPVQPGMAGLSPHAQPGYYPHSPTSHKKSSLLDKAGMAVAGALGASTLMGAARGGHKYNKLGPLAAGGGMGAALAGAAMTGHLNPKKAMKKQAKAQKKALKYGLPIAGVGLGAYALHKGLHHKKHHHGHHGHSSSSSSSSSD